MKNYLQKYLHVDPYAPDWRKVKQACAEADYAKEFLTVAEQEAACAAVVALCEAEIKLLVPHEASLREEFAQMAGHWQLGPPLAPYVVTEPTHKARVSRAAGHAALVIEVMTSGYVMRSSGYGWITTMLVSGAMTYVLAQLVRGAINFKTERKTPRESVALIQRRICKPAFYVTVLPLAVFLFVRVLGSSAPPSANDWVGLKELLDMVLSMLATIFDFCLWLATLGLVPLGAGFLALADQWGWSQRICAQLAKETRWWAELNSIREKYQARRGGGGTPPPPPASPSEPPSDSLPEGKQRALGASTMVPTMLPTLLFVLSLLIGLTGCQSSAEKTASHPNNNTTVTATPAVLTEPMSLRLYLDKSGSVKPEAAAIAAHTLHRQLPGLIETLGVTSLDLFTFADEGWSPQEVLTLTLPTRVTSQNEAGQDGRLPPNLQQRMAEQAERKYRIDLQQAVAKVDEQALNAATETQAHCTDLLGLFARMGEREEPGRQVYVIITDGYYSCKQKAPITEPKGNVTVLVMLTAAVDSESHGKGDADQYYTRKAALLKIAPWLIIVPADEPNLLHKLTQQPNRPAALAKAKAEGTEVQ